MDRIDYVFILAMCFAGPIDTLMTLPNWHLEGNPVVLSLGPLGLVAVKTVAILGAILVWIHTDIDEHPVGKLCAWFLCSLYGLVVVTNAIVLLS
jgi:hypothetical protein